LALRVLKNDERRTRRMLARISAALLAIIWAGMTPLHGQVQSPSADATAPIATDRPAITSSSVMTAAIAVFLAGLMVGRTPEYLGKKIGPAENKMMMLYALAAPLVVLPLTAIWTRRCNLAQNRVSDNVAPVKHFLSVLLRALRRARHFALAEGSAVPTKGSLAIISGPKLSSTHASLRSHPAIIITTSDSSVKEERDAPINSSMFYFTPSRFPGCPACEPNFFNCS